jgi:hypothetical protein
MWKSAHAVFPIPTYIEHSAYALDACSARSADTILRKYHDRGWMFYETLDSEMETSVHSIQPRRRVGDKYTWKITFDNTALNCTQETTADDGGLDENVFEMQKVEAQNDRRFESIVKRHYKISTHSSLIRNSYLRHTYVGPESWSQFLDTQLQLVAEMRKSTTSSTSRPLQSGEIPNHGEVEVEDGDQITRTMLDTQEIQQ